METIIVPVEEMTRDFVLCSQCDEKMPANTCNINSRCKNCGFKFPCGGD